MKFRTQPFVFAAAVALAASVGVEYTNAAEPPSGAIGPSQRVVRWTGQASPAVAGDDFRLKVDVGPEFWADKVGGVSIRIDWDSEAHDLELFVFGETNQVIARSQGKGTTFEQLFIDDASSDIPEYTVRVSNISRIGFVTYRAVATFDWVPEVVFRTDQALSFGPSTVVSAHFLGSEPMVSIERPVSVSKPGSLDPRRVFVDWPLTTRLAIGQLSRSEDGGNSFRPIINPRCAERSRPDCPLRGGGDTFNQVDLLDGTVYFSDQASPLAAHSFATSTNHGDSWPEERQHSFSNTTTVVDRQWVATTNSEALRIRSADQGLVPLRALLSYGGARMTVQGVANDGRPIPQPVHVTEDVFRMGPLRVDSTDGPGRGWVYQPYSNLEGTSDDALLPHTRDLGPPDVHVATVHAEDFNNPEKWRTNLIRQALSPQNFTWLDLDKHGNAYAVWDHQGKVYYSSSPIDDARNDPTATPAGRPGSYWTPIQRVSLPALGSATFAEVTAGDEGRIAIAYDATTDIRGSPDCGPEEGQPEPPCDEFAKAKWHTYAAVITNALGVGGPPEVTTGLVTPRVIHTGNICTEGADCMRENGEDRSLLDMIDIDHFSDGRIAVVYSDNNSTFAEASGEDQPKEDPFSHFATQLVGPTLSASTPVVDLPTPAGPREDPPGDATWPNTANGQRLENADLLSASLQVEGTDLVARVPLLKFSPDGVIADLNKCSSSIPPCDAGNRMQYVVRFLNDDDIFHMSMQQLRTGVRLFSGGRLDTNDQLRDPVGDIFAAGYRIDFPITGSVVDNTIELRAPLSGFGLAPGDQLFSVTAFSMAGPFEADESLSNPMRTIDATPPFDVVLAAQAQPTPTPAPTPTGSPTPGPTPTPTEEPKRPAQVTLTPTENTHDVGTEHTLVASVRDSDGNPVPNAGIGWTGRGQGQITSRDPSTDENGQAEAIVFSDEPGNLTVTVETSFCEEGRDCTATAEVHWGPDYCDIFGTSGPDELVGTDADETLCGFGADDIIRGGGGNDLLLGFRGFDELEGGDGDDTIKAGRGLDELFGDDGDDFLFGRHEDDLLVGGLGHDELMGGRRHDQLHGGPGRDLLDGRIGVDTCRGGRGRNTLRHCEF